MLKGKNLVFSVAGAVVENGDTMWWAFSFEVQQREWKQTLGLFLLLCEFQSIHIKAK